MLRKVKEDCCFPVPSQLLSLTNRFLNLILLLFSPLHANGPWSYLSVLPVCTTSNVTYYRQVKSEKWRPWLQHSASQYNIFDTQRHIKEPFWFCKNVTNDISVLCHLLFDSLLNKFSIDMNTSSTVKLFGELVMGHKWEGLLEFITGWVFVLSYLLFL
jgi:hypothetical protein